MLELGIGLLCWLIGAGFTLLGVIFWAWMLIDCLTKEPSEGNDKLIWVLVIIFASGIGAVIYYLVRRPERIRIYGR